jgi:hypothetical protein
MSQKLNTAIAVIGIDIGKNSFHVVGLDHRGAIVLRQKWSRGQVETSPFLPRGRRWNGAIILWVKHAPTSRPAAKRAGAGCRPAQRALASPVR